jgi:c-di-GMP phosphodiesterase
MGANGSEPSHVAGTVPSLDVLVARQPVLDRRLHVVGYELLYRTPDALGIASINDPEVATSRVIADTFGELGLERLVGARPAYINLTRDFLLAVRPLPLMPGRVVLELLEDQEVDDALVEVLREIVGKGFALALDDFVYNPSLDRLLELATLAKVDVRALAPEEAIEQARLLRERGVRVLAEKVETMEEFERYREAGFDYFQGFFFARPNVVHRRRMPSNTKETLGSLAELQATGGDFDRLEDVIRRDVGLSYRLLRYANSAFIGLASPVESVHDAMTRLGSRTVQQWATVLVLAAVAGKPHELVTTALVRARMCELLANGERDLAERAFTVGLFSVIDGLLDLPMEEAVAELPLVESVTTALLGGDNPEGRSLALVAAFERGDFQGIDPAGQLAAGDAYRKALAWADSASRSLG